jgi:hypothetical protein
MIFGQVISKSLLSITGSILVFWRWRRWGRAVMRFVWEESERDGENVHVLCIEQAFILVEFVGDAGVSIWDR